MQFHKVYCHEHNYEPISNFCADPQCLVGLCATCVCEHTRSHAQRGTPPAYENIKDTYSRYNDRMREQIDLIEQDKVWLSNICNDIEGKRQNVRDTVAKAREDSLALVNKHFDDLENKISSEIVNETKKNSLHSAYRLETLNTLMLKQLSNLLLYSKDLSSSKFLETAKVVEDDVFPNSREFHLKVSKELKENEVYSANAVYKEEFLGDLAHSLKRLVNLEFLLPKVDYVAGPPQKMERVDKLDDARRSMSLKRNNSAVMVSRPNDLSVSRNVSIVMPAPARQPSMVITSNPNNPFYHLQQNTGVNRSEVTTPLLQKSGRMSNFSSGLKMIKETKREITPRDNMSNMSSLTSSRASCPNKENEVLAKSTYIDTNSSFYR